MPGYIVPIRANVPVTIQKFTGKYAHENFLESFYAIDFVVPVDTPIIASRAGQVFMVKQDSKKWGLNATFKDLNVVVIKHDDDTLAEYAHLGCQKVLVKVGQKVKQGETIALSGMSGCMTIPHLHFNVFKLIGKKAVSIQISFADVSAYMRKSVA